MYPGTRIGLVILWLLRFLPLPVLDLLAAVVGTLAFHTPMSRTTRINLHACFPELSLSERDRLTRSYLRALSRSLLELGILWWSSHERIRQLVQFKNLELVDLAGDRPVIFLTPHMVGLEMQGARMGMHFRGASLFTPQKNPLMDRLVRQARDRLGDIIMLDRKKGLRPAIRALQEGRRLYILPDMDFGERNALFPPFFGIPAATVATVPRLAALTGAVVIPSVCHQLPHGKGYEVEFFPPWENYPSADPVADTARMNAFIEAEVRRYPEQYFWGHKRFRTRPDPSEPPFYRWPQSLD